MACCFFEYPLKSSPLDIPPVAYVLSSIYSFIGTTTRVSLEYIMYAVIQSGGKQHRVVEGETLKVELLKAETGRSEERRVGKECRSRWLHNNCCTKETTVCR